MMVCSSSAFQSIFKIYPYHPLRSQRKFSLLSARRFSWCSLGEFGIGSTNNFSLFSSLVCMMSYGIGRRNSALVTCGSWRLTRILLIIVFPWEVQLQALALQPPQAISIELLLKKISLHFSATDRKKKQPYQVENVYLTQHQVTREYRATRREQINPLIPESD